MCAESCLLARGKHQANCIACSPVCGPLLHSAPLRDTPKVHTCDRRTVFRPHHPPNICERSVKVFKYDVLALARWN